MALIKNNWNAFRLKDSIFIPEFYVYDLLKYEAPEVLKKSESLTMSSTSNVRSDWFLDSIITFVSNKRHFFEAFTLRVNSQRFVTWIFKNILW